MQPAFKSQYSKLYGFSSPVSDQKTGPAFAFFFIRLSNRNPDKAFAGLSKKKYSSLV